MPILTTLAAIIAAMTRLVSIQRSQMTKAQVERVLTEAARERSPEHLNPLTSIVDLQKVLDQDSSFAARRSLWRELGCEGIYDGTPEQNTKLHELVMDEVAKGYVDIPKEG